MKKSQQNLMEKSIISNFSTEIPGSTFPVLLKMNLLCLSTCGTPSRNIIVRVLLKSKYLTNQTLQRHGGTLTCVPNLISLGINETNILDVV